MCNEKKRSEEMQTLRAGCSKLESKKIYPAAAADPLPGGAGGATENAGVKNAIRENCKGGKCRSGKSGSRSQGWKTQE